MTELRLALRSLRRAPVYSVASILTLALGIALVTAVFSVVDAVLIRPLPYQQIDQVVELAQRNAQGGSTGVSYPNFTDWQQQLGSSAFSGIGYARGRGTALTLADRHETVLVAFVTPKYLDLLKPQLQMGRFFGADEEERGEHVAVVTWATWQSQLGGDPAILGRSLSTTDGVFTVVGVLARDAVFPQWAQLYIPISTIAATESVLGARGFHADSRAIGRLKPGVDVARATAELGVIARRLANAYPAENREWPGVQLLPLRIQLLGNASSQLTMLSVAMLLVLLIAWVNVTNLALVRSTSRLREVAIRTSLGASQPRIIRQVLVEQGVLAVAACAVGVFAATFVLSMIRGFGAGAPGAETIAINGRATLFAVVTALVSALVVGLLPAMRVAAANLSEPLREGAHGSGVSRKQHRIRSVLVVGEIGLALMLVISAGLLVRSFWRLSNVDPGFDTHHLVAIDLSPPGSARSDPKLAALFYSQVLERVRTIPGIQSAALTNHMPLNGAALPVSVEVAGRAADPARDPQVLFRTLSPEYPATMHIPVKRGRGFTSADLTAGTAVMVNEAFAAAYWPGVDPVGHQLTLRKSAQGFADLGEPLAATVVGVLADVHHFGVATAPVPEVYLPYTRNPWSHMVVIARAQGDAAAMVPSMRREILSVNQSTVVTGGVFGGFQVIDEIREAGTANARFNMQLLGSFALCALLLAAIGVYGLMAYAMTQRNREMGIRLALGARAADVRLLALGAGARLVIVGMILGVVGALGLTRFVSSQLFGVTATDPVTFAVMTGLMACVGLLACYLPAVRAGRVDPAVVLRND